MTFASKSSSQDSETTLAFLIFAEQVDRDLVLRLKSQFGAVKTDTESLNNETLLSIASHLDTPEGGAVLGDYFSRKWRTLRECTTKNENEKELIAAAIYVGFGQLPISAGKFFKALRELGIDVKPAVKREMPEALWRLCCENAAAKIAQDKSIDIADLLRSHVNAKKRLKFALVLLGTNYIIDDQEITPGSEWIENVTSTLREVFQWIVPLRSIWSTIQARIGPRKPWKAAFILVAIIVVIGIVWMRSAHCETIREGARKLIGVRIPDGYSCKKAETALTVIRLIGEGSTNSVESALDLSKALSKDWFSQWLLAVALNQSEKYVESITACELAYSWCDALPNRLEVLLTKMEALVRSGNVIAAHEIEQEIIVEIKHVEEADNREALERHFAICRARLLVTEGDAGRAVEILEKLSDYIWRSDGETCQYLSILGLAYQKLARSSNDADRAKYNESARLQTFRAYRIQMNSVPEGNLSASALALNLALMASSVKDYAEASVFSHQSYLIRKRLLGASNPLTLKAFQSYILSQYSRLRIENQVRQDPSQVSQRNDILNQARELSSLAETSTEMSLVERLSYRCVLVGLLLDCGELAEGEALLRTLEDSLTLIHNRNVAEVGLSSLENQARQLRKKLAESR